MRPDIFLGFMRKPFLFISNLLNLAKWVSQQDKEKTLNDFYCLKRNYARRYELYQYVMDKFNLNNESIDSI